MKKIHLLFGFCFHLLFLQAQTKFEQGYIIDDFGNKIDCFIKNVDWVNNPTQIDYKLSLESKDIQSFSASDIKEFGIGVNIVFKKFTVDIDKSLNNNSNLSVIKEPEFQKETLLLKQLVKGNANLYYYEGQNLSRFFYSLDNDETIYQLIYKKYKENNTLVATNASFRSTLYYEFKCEDLTAEDSRNLNYEKKDLINFFSAYNNCSGSDSQVFLGEKRKGHLKLKLKAGLTNFNSEIKFDQTSLQVDLLSADLSKSTNLRIGVEVEYVLPFNNNKWSLFAEPAYQSYQGNGVNRNFVTQGQIVENNISLSYSYIDIPIGLRHYFFLSNTSRIFINAAWVVVLDLEGDIRFQIDSAGNSIAETLPNLNVNSQGNIVFGIGYEFNNKFSMEFRLSSSRDITKDFVFIKTGYVGTSFILGYTFL